MPIDVQDLERRLPRLQRPQDAGPHGDRRLVRKAGVVRGDGAAPRRRRDDPRKSPGVGQVNDIPYKFRRRDAEHRRGDRAWGRGGLPHEDRDGRGPRHEMEITEVRAGEARPLERRSDVWPEGCQEAGRRRVLHDRRRAPARHRLDPRRRGDLASGRATIAPAADGAIQPPCDRAGRPSTSTTTWTTPMRSSRASKKVQEVFA